MQQTMSGPIQIQTAKKRLALALAAVLFISTVAVAAAYGGMPVAPSASFTFGAPEAASAPATTNNDDACDISVTPAATLLLPYFEVDFRAAPAAARTTIFTITNTSQMPEIAHCVVWTDWAFAAFTFNIYLTGYDVQSINLYDVFRRGVIAPVSAALSGTSSTNPVLSPVGTTPPNERNATPMPNTSGNPNFRMDANVACANLPGVIAAPVLEDIQQIFTTGRSGSIVGLGCGTIRLGGVHANAIGYLTIDVDSTCSTSFPGPLVMGTYSNHEILFDNVLLGDYKDVDPNPATGNDAAGNPMVHIRAVPEGGPVGSNPGTNLPFTFYDHYNTGGAFGSGALTALTSGPNRLADRRQPLPSVFAARWIQSGAAGFSTHYKIWREGTTGPGSSSCTTAGIPTINSAIAITDLIRFDEHENANGIAPPIFLPEPVPGQIHASPAASSAATSSYLFPGLLPSGDAGGWMYLNLANRYTGPAYSNPALDNPVAHPGFVDRASQNWVVVSMFAEGRYSIDFDVAWLGNGCSAPVSSGLPVGPVGATPVCPKGTPACIPGKSPYIGTNLTP
jgi:hypothetical protein